MANAAANILNGQIEKGIVITKYGHIQGDIPGIECFEAGHPVPDTNTFAATQKVIELTEELQADDQVLFLLSGGGSALFEKPLISTEELSDIKKQLLACGADIVEMNTIRKRLSAVKGGKFAGLCEPAAIFAIVLSDIVGDPLDMIASGPAYADSSTASDAIAIVEKYHLKLSEKARTLLEMKTPKADRLDHLNNPVNGICKLLDDGIAVLSDRYVFSNYAYQSVSVPLEWIMKCNEMANEIVRPDCHIFIDVSPETAMERVTRGRHQTDIYETKERLTDVRDRYLDLIHRMEDVENIIIVDGNRSPQEISDDIWAKVCHYFV